MKINQDIVQFVGIIDFVFIYTKYNSGDKNQHQDILRDHVRYFHLKKKPISSGDIFIDKK